MRTLLLLFLLYATIPHVTGQTPGMTDFSPACDAAFTPHTDPFNPMTIHFEDQSSGQITLWQWSFGDGATTTIQNPVHTYAAGGTYFVCLTVSSSDSANICHDVLCLAITIHEPGTCVADYQFTIDPFDLLKAQFTDHSSGNINGWHWDFGDGSVSNERNPSHIFPSFGKFRVCLLAYNVDSVSECNDVKCDSVEVIPAPFCHAMFTSQLDSLNAVPNTFIFINNSTGDPNRYHWIFDDGASFNTRNVIHSFQVPGLHEVCLVIKREEHGKIVCTDSLCQSISTAKYFDIGGHLFIGAFPINNPVSTGDTGVAFLYRIDGSRLIPYDTSRFTRLGYYAFPKILNGSYLLRAVLTPGSLNYSKYFPGYFRQALVWKEANILNLSDSNSYVSDTHLSPADDALSGPCMVDGTVLKSNSKDHVEKIPFAEVMLYDAQLKPLHYTFTDKSGQFRLNNIPYGAYYLQVECPGKYSRLTAVWLDSSTPVIDSLLLEVFNHDVTAIPEIAVCSVLTGDLFPNPADNLVNLAIEVAGVISLNFEIRTLAGLTVWSGSVDCNTGSNLVTIPVMSLRAGLYLFMIKMPDGSPIAVKKLLRY
jgi:PKD repeat protein